MSLTKSELYNFINASTISGESAWDIWKFLNPDGTEQEFIEALRGKSALEFWLELEVNNGKTEEDFYNWLATDNSELIAKEITDREAAIIQVLTDAKAYADQKADSEKTAREAADTQLLDTSKAYTDNKVADETVAREAADVQNLETSKTYIDSKITEEAISREAADTQNLADAKAYTNTKIEAEEAARIAIDEQNLIEAKSYTDSQISIEVSNREAADTQVLNDAKSYIDASISNVVNNNQTTNTNIVTEVKSYTDEKISVETAAREAGDEQTLTEAKSYTNEVISNIKNPDYNQNDENESDYIKNRPFYTTDPVETVVFEETTVEGFAQEEDGIYWIGIEGDYGINLKFGQKYTVIWDGTIYENLICFYDYEDHAIGASHDNLLSDTPEYPFNICDYGIYTNDTTNTSHTIKIIGHLCEIIKIDEKYLTNNNIKNGSAIGSLRTLGSCEENDEYTMGKYAFAEGLTTKASGYVSHAEGEDTTASGLYSHAEGEDTTASGNASHAEGYNTIASGMHSHAEGVSTTASKYASHAEGSNTKASSSNQHVQGKFNIEDKEDKYAHIVGNGTAYNARSNAHTVDWDGNAWYAGDVYVGGTSQDDGSKLATETFVTTQVKAEISETLQSNYDLWLSLGNEGTPSDFIEYLRGDSAYQIWLEQEGNEGKTEEDFLNSFGASTLADLNAVDTHGLLGTNGATVNAQSLVDKMIPTDEEMLNMFAELDIVQPAADSNGAIYTDNDGKILIL